MQIFVKKMDRDFLVIAVVCVQITDRNQTLDFAIFINHRQMPNAVLTEDAASFVGGSLGIAASDFRRHHIAHLNR